MEIRKCLAENPDLPVYVLGDGGVPGEIRRVSVDCFIDGQDATWFKSDGLMWATLQDVLNAEEFAEVAKHEETAPAVYENLPWQEAVIVEAW